MRTYQLSPRATRELLAILDQVEDYSGPEKADRVEHLFVAAFEEIGQNPGKGHRRPDLTSEDVFFFNALPYQIVFDRYELPTKILAVYHSSRHPGLMLRNLR
jgi:plasmid stabilization system protein ParE